MNKRILFVDDEPMVLQGIQRSLRPMRKEWEMEFASSGAEALATMERIPVDVVISDMRMPGMSGAELLEQVKFRFPRTVRMVLSGQSDQETILRSIGPTHQYLSKPCDVADLRQKLNQAFALRDLLDNPKIKEIVSRIDTLPSLPSLYVAITRALEAPDTSISEIGKIIAKDIGMSTKVLQLVNSAFFCLPCHVSNPNQAVALIGIDNIRALVLSVHVFSECGQRLAQELSFLWAHSISTATFAKAIARSQGVARSVEDDSFTAGLLHDVGMLVLASACAAEYRSVLRKAADNGGTIHATEQAALGCTHAEVGAYLLGLWGLPDPIVEAVAWHYRPALAQPAGFSPLIAVHAADAFDRRINSESFPFKSEPVDESLLSNLGLNNRLQEWAKACEEFDLTGENNA
jgi:HD-like signal output (HDOD) protein